MLLVETIQKLRGRLVEIHRLRRRDLAGKRVPDGGGKDFRLAQKPRLHLVNSEELKKVLFLHNTFDLLFCP